MQCGVMPNLAACQTAVESRTPSSTKRTHTRTTLAAARDAYRSLYLTFVESIKKSNLSRRHHTELALYKGILASLFRGLLLPDLSDILDNKFSR